MFCSGFEPVATGWHIFIFSNLCPFPETTRSKIKCLFFSAGHFERALPALHLHDEDAQLGKHLDRERSRAAQHGAHGRQDLVQLRHRAVPVGGPRRALWQSGRMFSGETL